MRISRIQDQQKHFLKSFAFSSCRMASVCIRSILFSEVPNVLFTNHKYSFSVYCSSTHSVTRYRRFSGPCPIVSCSWIFSRIHRSRLRVKKVKPHVLWASDGVFGIWIFLWSEITAIRIFDADCKIYDFGLSGEGRYLPTLYKAKGSLGQCPHL